MKVFVLHPFSLGEGKDAHLSSVVDLDAELARDLIRKGFVREATAEEIDHAAELEAS